ncbi:hypothetical protein CEXT_513061 [Caerostris extrusa]|uniref:Uncharacterized protein n=1 Tax=Caerostris extrusa TaxID=172846 RepID=A0AAV4PIT2_CAEEX|nr:hypothetical protein CEXT_513061 [Caerostris extrusa]
MKETYRKLEFEQKCRFTEFSPTYYKLKKKAKTCRQGEMPKRNQNCSRFIFLILFFLFFSSLLFLAETFYHVASQSSGKKKQSSNPNFKKEADRD